MDAVLKSACQHACAKFKERLQNILEPSQQLSIPSEVVGLLQLPQRHDKTLLKEIFKVFVDSKRRDSIVSTIHKMLQQNLPARPTRTRGPFGTAMQDLQSLVREIQLENGVKDNTKKLQEQMAAAKKKKKEEEEDDQNEAMADDGAVEEDNDLIYESYRSFHVDGKKHPDPIVETASLASVELPSNKYKHHLSELATSGALSDAQLETVVYANMRFRQKIEGGANGGFFLGDGAGVGKGRQIAALSLEHWRTGGRRILWISVSNDLRYDAERDLSDVGAQDIKVWPRGNAVLPKGRLDRSHTDGVLFITYSLLVANLKGIKDDNPQSTAEVKTVDASIPKGSRLEQVVDWLKGEAEPLVILDECHKAKNLIAVGGKSTQTGKAILKLQMNVPGAKVLYSSATGASEPNNLAYMLRLGTCGYGSMADLVGELNTSGLGALEMFSMGLKATGCYLSRTLSYKGAEFQIAKVKMDQIFKVMYNRSCEFWHLLSSIVTAIPKPGKKCMSQFYSAQQRFYRQMLMAAKVPETARIALEALENDMCVVIGLQSTGEANTLAVKELMGDSLDDFVSAPQQILLGWLNNHFPRGRCDMPEAQIHSLYFQVREAIQLWRDILPAKEQAEMEAEMEREEILRQMQARTRQAQNSLSTAQGGEAAESSDDEGPIVTEELNLDQAIAREREEQKLAGRFIDLDNYSEAHVKKAKAAMEKEDQEERALQVKEEAARQNSRKAALEDNVREAQQNVLDCEADLAKIQKALDALDEGSPVAQESDDENKGRKRLQRRNADLGGMSGSDSEDERPIANRRPIMIDSSDDEATRDLGPSKRKRPTGGHSVSVVDLVTSSDEEEEVTSAKKPKTSVGRAISPEKPAIKIDYTEEDDFPAEEEVIEIDDDDVACIKCGSKDADEIDMLICDGCGSDGAHHLSCLDPPLTIVPDGDWYCPSCTKQRAKQKAPASGLRQSTLAFTGLKNAGALRMQLTAARKRLEIAQQELKKAKQTQEREGRVQGRSSIGGRRRTSRNIAVEAMSSGSEVEAEDDSDYESESEGDANLTSPQRKAKQREHNGRIIKEEACGGTAGGAGGKLKPGVKQTQKTGEYRHHVQQQQIGDDWEDRVAAGTSNGGGAEVDEEHPVMLRIIDMLSKLVKSMELPANPLDQLTELMGGPTKVAEMTGRKGQLIREDENTVVYKNRRQDEGISSKMINMKEKGDFMDGRKLIAIISDAASTGISLQADRRQKNQRRRCHLTLELPWSADKAIQQFGRSHRSNQTSAPLYRIIVTECAGEFRFAASAAKRLQSLGALLKGDRRALGAGQDLQEFDCDNKYGLIALKRIFSDMIGNSSAMPGVTLPELPQHVARAAEIPETARTPFYDYIKPKMVQVGMLRNVSAHGYSHYSEEPNVVKKVSVWLNRVLAMTLNDQSLIFKYFNDTYDACVLAAKSRGEYDKGITSVTASSIKVKKKIIIHTEPTSSAKTYHTELELDRGCSWEAAKQARDDWVAEKLAAGKKDVAKSGFWIGRKKHGPQNMPLILLATEIDKIDKVGGKHFRIRRPNIEATKQASQGELENGHTRLRQDEKAEKIWRYWHELTENCCMHGPSCRRRLEGNVCYHGARKQSMHLISGAVLPVLNLLYGVINSSLHNRGKDGKRIHRKVYRAKLDDEAGIVVGMDVHKEDAKELKRRIEDGDEMCLPGTSGAGMHFDNEFEAY